MHKTIEQQLEQEKQVNQAIIGLLEEALQEVGYDDATINGLTTSGKISFLVRAAKDVTRLRAIEQDVAMWRSLLVDVISPDGWLQLGEYETCPSCSNSSVDGHKADCKLAQVLGREE